MKKAHDDLEIHRLVKALGGKGWRLAASGVTYLNGTLAAHLMKDGEVLMLSQDLAPDEEWIADEWPPEDSAATRR